MKNEGRLLSLLLMVTLAVASVVGALLSSASSATQAQGSDIVIDTSMTWAAGTYAYGSVTITSNATLTLDGAVTLNCMNLTIESGAAVSVDGRGYAAENGPGRGASTSEGGTAYGGAGAGYGGKGGHGSDASTVTLVEGGPAYGSMLHPTDLGSGGGQVHGLGGSGGGAIRLDVSGTLTIDGTISANGNNGGGFGIEPVGGPAEAHARA